MISGFSDRVFTIPRKGGIRVRRLIIKDIGW
jgi:hypothetical protein